MSNKDIFSFNPFTRDIEDQVSTPSSNTGIMSKDMSSTSGPMGEQMDDSYDPFSFVERFAKDLVSLFDENEEDKEKLKNTYMVDTKSDRLTARDTVLDGLVVDYNAAFERGRSLQETMDTIETMSLLPIGTEGVLQSPTPMSRPVLSAPAPQRRPRGLMEDGDGFTTLPLGGRQFESGITDPGNDEEEDGFVKRVGDVLSDVGEILVPAAAASEAIAGGKEVKPLQQPATDKEFIADFVTKMGAVEGVTDHMASEGQFTYAYGILPSTAKGFGINPQKYNNRSSDSDKKDFAEAVYSKMYDEARNKYPDVFKGLGDSEKAAVLSTYINLGKLNSGIVKSLSGNKKDFASAGKSLTKVIHYTDSKTKNKYASKGLSLRRAAEYNVLMAGQKGFSPVTQVTVTGTKQKPVFNWLDSQGRIVESFKASQPLSPDNSMSPVKLPGAAAPRLSSAPLTSPAPTSSPFVTKRSSGAPETSPTPARRGLMSSEN